MMSLRLLFPLPPIFGCITPRLLARILPVTKSPLTFTSLWLQFLICCPRVSTVTGWNQSPSGHPNTCSIGRLGNRVVLMPRIASTRISFATLTQLWLCAFLLAALESHL